MLCNHQHIIDKILLYVGDIHLSIKLKNDFVTKKLYNPEIHTYNWAAYKGHLDIVKFLHENRTEGCSYDTMNLASKNGHLEVVIYLHENRTEGFINWAINYAASNGHLEIVKFLHNHRTEGCSTYAMDWAAEYGHLDIIKFLHNNRTEEPLCTTLAMNCAAKMDILKLLIGYMKIELKGVILMQ